MCVCEYRIPVFDFIQSYVCVCECEYRIQFLPLHRALCVGVNIAYTYLPSYRAVCVCVNIAYTFLSPAFDILPLLQIQLVYEFRHFIVLFNCINNMHHIHDLIFLFLYTGRRVLTWFFEVLRYHSIASMYVQLVSIYT